MIKQKLKNGLTFIFKKTQNSTVTIEINVKAGSINEKKGMRGISHFLEHMLFEGTPSRPSSFAIASEIENLGGEFNAATTNERTLYYVKVLNKHFTPALNVLLDIIQNPLFDDSAIEKEKKVILNEIDMINDEPRFFQWVLLESTLYSKSNPFVSPVYGHKDDVRSFGKNMLFDYHSRFYVPNNIVITIIGNIDNPSKLIEKGFSKRKKPITRHPFSSPKPFSRPFVVQKQKQIQQSYMLMGFNTCSTKNKDSIALDVIRAHLGRGFSGSLFEEIRNKHGLAYELGVVNETKINFGYFAIYLNASPENIPVVQKIIFEEIEKIEQLTQSQLNVAKSYLEGEFALMYEDPQRLADILGFLELVGNADIFHDYVKTLKKLQLKDIIEVKRKYLKNPAIILIQPESGKDRKK